MSRRTRVPSAFSADPETENWADRIEKRKVAAVSQLSSTATAAQIATAFNALVTAMQTSGAMEST
jgi:hypothetical protein